MEFSQQAFSWVLGLIGVGVVALIGAVLKTRADLADLRYAVAKEYLNKGDITDLKASVTSIQGELQLLLKSVYQIQADLKASHTHGGQ